MSAGCAVFQQRDETVSKPVTSQEDRKVAQAITGDAVLIEVWLDYCRERNIRPKLNANLDPTRYINYVYYNEAYRMYADYASNNVGELMQRVRWNQALLSYYNQMGH